MLSASNHSFVRFIKYSILFEMRDLTQYKNRTIPQHLFTTLINFLDNPITVHISHHHQLHLHIHLETPPTALLIMHTLHLLLTAALLAAPTLAHISMIKPLPINHKLNPNTVSSSADYSYSAPLLANGTDYPCKNYHKLLSTPAGTPVEIWPAGTVQTMGIGDATGANHNGGSCQIALSDDAGATFKVIKSFIGACPMSTRQTLEVEIPKEAKDGKTIFAWTWFNKTGNREMYMNCAVVTITGGGSGLTSADWPPLFTANIGGTCTTTENIDTVFPNPGKNVVTAQGNVTPGPPVGECGAAGVASLASAESPAAGTATPSPTESPAAAAPLPGGEAAACSCVCGGPSGYMVNIVPAAAGVSEGVMAARTVPPENVDASGGEGLFDEQEKTGPTCGAKRRDHMRRHAKNRRSAAAERG